MKTYIVASAIWFSLTISAFGQASPNIQVQDTTGSNPPISLKGSVQLGKDKSTCIVTGHNLSKTKGLLAMVVDVFVTDSRGYPLPLRYEHEAFFKLHGIGPDADFDVTGGAVDFPMGNEQINGVQVEPRSDITPHAEAMARFVQYEDGTTWGDAQIGAALIAERAQVQTFLSNLLTTYSDKGASALAAALSEPQPLGTTLHSMAEGLKVDMADSGPEALVIRIQKLLAAAQARAAKLSASPQ